MSTPTPNDPIIESVAVKAPESPDKSYLGVGLVGAITICILLFLTLHTFGRVHELERVLSEQRQQSLTQAVQIETCNGDQKRCSTSLMFQRKEHDECKSDLASYRRQIDEILPSAIDVGKKLDACYHERDLERSSREELSTEIEALRVELETCRGRLQELEKTNSDETNKENSRSTPKGEP